MYKLILAIALLGSAPALACLPSGDRLDAKEKKAFAADMKKLNPACLKAITEGIGAVTSEDVFVFESGSDMKVDYAVIGRSKQTRITKIKIMGKLTYTCGPIRGKTRGC